MSGRLICPKTWDRIVGIFGARFGQSMDCLGDLCDNLCIYYDLVCMRSEMAMGFGSTKWNPCLMSGLPMDSPLLV